MKKPTAGAPVPKAKVHHHHKPVHVTPAVKAKRHAAAVKASKTRAANAKKAKQHPQAKQHPRRQLALGEGVACCSAEALAASLRLAGMPVSDKDVLALYWRTATDADAGASILATLEAAARFGLAGFHPLAVDLIGHLGERSGNLERLGSGEVVDARFILRSEQLDGGTVDVRDAPELAQRGRVVRRLIAGNASHALILGIDLPGPHAVLATADGWQSWGGLYDPWTDEIDEAWEVTWPGIR